MRRLAAEIAVLHVFVQEVFNQHFLDFQSGSIVQDALRPLLYPGTIQTIRDGLVQVVDQSDEAPVPGIDLGDARTQAVTPVRPPGWRCFHNYFQ